MTAADVVYLVAALCSRRNATRHSMSACRSKRTVEGRARHAVLQFCRRLDTKTCTRSASLAQAALTAHAASVGLMVCSAVRTSLGLPEP